MKTNTLLAAAAILAVGGLAAQAQVYSQNVVGYYNITIPANGYNLVANQLINGSDTAQTNNSVSSVLATGLISDPNGNNNSELYYWNGAGYGQYQYFTSADAIYNFGLTTAANGWYDGNGNLVNLPLNQGGGSFIRNLQSTNIIVTVVGTVPQGTNVLTIAQGFNIYSIVPPVSTNIESSLVGFPGTSDPNGNNNDYLYQWNGNGYGQYQYFTAADAIYNFGLTTASNGFYDGNGNLINSAPPVGQAFFIDHVVSTTVLWTNSFSVQ